MSEKCKNDQWDERYEKFYIEAIKLFVAASRSKRKLYRETPASLMNEAIDATGEFFDGGDDIDYMNPYYCTSCENVMDEHSPTPEWEKLREGRSEIELEALDLALEGRSCL